MDIQDKDDAWSITYHFVWQPMRSKACLTDEVARRLRALVEEQAELLEFHPRALIILPDRVYLAAEAPPTLAPHSIVCRVKSLTSRALRHEFPELTRIPTLWTRQYLVLAGDEMTPEEVLTRFQSLLRPRRPRGRPRKNTSESQSPDVHSDDG